MGKIVGVATYESRLGEAFFQVRSAYDFLKPEMLTYAEKHLTGVTNDGTRYLKVYTNDFNIHI